MTTKDVIINIGANSKELQRELMRSHQALAKFAIAAGAVGVTAAAGISAVSSAVKEYSQFEKGFSNVVTLLDESSFKTKSLNDGIIELGRGINNLRGSTGRSFDDLNKSLFDLVSAGIEASDAIDVLKVSSDLALAGATETGIAVDGLSSAMNAYGYEATKAQEIAEKFFTAQKLGKTTIAELSSDFGKVGATASAMGVSFDEVLASVSAVTLAGVKTNEAYTGLKAVLSNIINPSKDATDEANRLGVEFNSLALRTKGLERFLSDLKGSTKFNAESMEKLFGSTEALNVVLALTGGQADSFKNILTELNAESSRGETFQKALAEKADTVDEAYNRLEGSASALKATLGEVFAPAFINSADNLSESMRVLNAEVRDAEIGFSNLLDKLDDLATAQYNFTASLSNMPKIEDPFSEVNPSEALGYSKGSPFQALVDGAMSMANDVKDSLDSINEKEAEIQAIRDARAAAAQEKEDEIARRKAEKAAERAEAEREREEEARQLKLEREEERFEEDVELLNERLASLDKIESEFSGLKELRDLQELKTKAKTADQKQKIDKATALASEKYSKHQALAAAESLESILGTTTAVGKAIFLFNKAMAIADTIKTAQQASQLAYASQLVPGDPSSIARAEIARNITLVRGAVSAAAIAGTAIQGMHDGGVVGGAGVGDKVLKLLEPGEIVVPNTAAPTFTQMFGNFPDGRNTKAEDAEKQGEISVMIGLSDDAAQVLTVQQYEDSRIGVAR